MKLLIVIVNYNSTDLTIDCLESISGQISEIDGGGVVVCENGSGEQAVKKLNAAIRENGWRKWVGVKVLRHNRGFAGGNNAVLRCEMRGQDKPDYFLLLNSDTIVRPGALSSMLGAGESNKEVGIISPRLEWPDQTPQISCFNYLNPIDEMLGAAKTGVLTNLFESYHVPVPVSDKPIWPDWTSFACALIRRKVIEKVGLLDEDYYLYFDDVDYCRRAREQGWKVLHWPDARVVHLRGQSNPVKELTQRCGRRPDYYYASRSRYFAKYYGRSGLWGANMLWHAGRGVSWMREKVGNKQRHTCEFESRDIWKNWREPMASPVIDLV